MTEEREEDERKGRVHGPWHLVDMSGWLPKAPGVQEGSLEKSRSEALSVISNNSFGPGLDGGESRTWGPGQEIHVDPQDTRSHQQGVGEDVPAASPDAPQAADRASEASREAAASPGAAEEASEEVPEGKAAYAASEASAEVEKEVLKGSGEVSEEEKEEDSPEEEAKPVEDKPKRAARLRDM